jgi:hypothetical protein
MEKNNVIQIGRCYGCNKFTRLDDNVCNYCLSNPRRGRKWAEVAGKIRNNKIYALAFFNAIKIEENKQVFIEEFGDPRTLEAIL